MIYDLQKSSNFGSDAIGGCLFLYALGICVCVINQHAKHIGILMASHYLFNGSMDFGADENHDKWLCFRNKSFISVDERESKSKSINDCIVA